MSIHGYCGNCDEQIELHEGTVFQVVGDDGRLYVNIQCPWCEDYEEVKL